MSKDTIPVTIWQNNGGVLSKTISAGPDGKPVSDGSACKMSRGIGEVKKLGGLNGLAQTIDTMKSSVALSLVCGSGLRDERNKSGAQERRGRDSSAPAQDARIGTAPIGARRDNQPTCSRQYQRESKVEIPSGS